jgi:hypothetical protein
MTLYDFDQYVEDNNIQPDELGQAFAAWMHLTTGWDGEANRVERGEKS